MHNRLRDPKAHNFNNALNAKKLPNCTDERMHPTCPFILNIDLCKFKELAEAYGLDTYIGVEWMLINAVSLNFETMFCFALIEIICLMSKFLII